MITGVLLLGVTYAAIQNITLTINCTATATPDQGNFKVKFLGILITSGNETITHKITSDTTAIFMVTALKTVGDTATVTFSISNESNEFLADISKKIIHTNSTYFKVISKIDGSYDLDVDSAIIASEDKGYIRITVELIQLPINANVTDNKL